MYLKGFKVKRCPSIGYRPSNANDRDLSGSPTDKHNVTFVQISDCEIKEENGKKYYVPDKAPAIPVVHGGTYYGYGKWRVGTKGHWFGTLEEPLYETAYLTCPVYFVHDGNVYTATNYQRIQDATAKALLQAGLDDEKRQDKLPGTYKAIVQNTILEHGKKMLATELKV